MQVYCIKFHFYCEFIHSIKITYIYEITAHFIGPENCNFHALLSLLWRGVMDSKFIRLIFLTTFTDMNLQIKKDLFHNYMSIQTLVSNLLKMFFKYRKIECSNNTTNHRHHSYIWDTRQWVETVKFLEILNLIWVDL